MINFILEYWIFAALFLAAWAFWKVFVFPVRRNVANVKGDGNKVVQFGGTSKEIQEQIEELLKQHK